MTPMRWGRIRGAIGQWGPVVVMMAVIFIASATPGNEIPKFGQADTLVKKSGHFLGYALLGITLLRAYAFRLNWRSATPSAFITLVLFAFSDEFHQRFTPGRHPSIFDVGIDSLGGIFGLTLMIAWQLWKSHRSRSTLLPGK